MGGREETGDRATIGGAHRREARTSPKRSRLTTTREDVRRHETRQSVGSFQSEIASPIRTRADDGDARERERVRGSDDDQPS